MSYQGVDARIKRLISPPALAFSVYCITVINSIPYIKLRCLYFQSSFKWRIVIGIMTKKCC